MNKIIEFYRTHRYVIIWNVCYVMGAWLLLRGMFGFNIFSAADWHILRHARLHGIGGLAFGILMMAAVPMYVATTLIVARTGKPLFTVARPKIIDLIVKKLTPTPAPRPEPAPATPETTTTVTIQDDEVATMPEQMPNELRAAFMRARRKINTVSSVVPAKEILINESATAYTPQNNATEKPDQAPFTPPAPVSHGTITDIDSDFPIPTDFDTDTTYESTEPTLHNLSFSTMFDTRHKNSEPQSDTPDNETAPTTEQKNDTDIIAVLKSMGHDAQTDGDLIISGDTAIAVHNDADFWIADETLWFAAGKQRPSPITTLMSAKSPRRVLYLGATNIMDLDNNIARWQEMGIRVVRNIDDIFND